MDDPELVAIRQGFGERLRELLQKAGYWGNKGPATTRFCREHGFSTWTFQKWADGAALPRPQEIIRLATALKVSPGLLLFGEKAAKAFAALVVSSATLCEVEARKIRKGLGVATAHGTRRNRMPQRAVAARWAHSHQQ